MDWLKKIDFAMTTDTGKVTFTFVLFAMILGFIISWIAIYCNKKIMGAFARAAMNAGTIDEEALRQKVLDLSEWECPQFTPEVMEGAVRRLQRCMLEERINDLKQQILRISNPESQAALLNERMQLQRELRGYLDEEKHQD